MLRAISEIAVAMSVCSVLEKPHAAESSRPLCLASTTSVSRPMGTHTSTGTMAAPSEPRREERQTFFQIECRCDAVERQSELDHRERDFGLDADHDRVGAAKPRG